MRLLQAISLIISIVALVLAILVWRYSDASIAWRSCLLIGGACGNPPSLIP